MSSSVTDILNALAAFFNPPAPSNDDLGDETIPPNQKFGTGET